MAIVGTIKEIWRFPVKSMQGDTITEARVSSHGVLGDRVWAMRDEARAEIQWGKKYPLLMQCKARYLNEPDGAGPAPVAVTFPDGETINSNDERVHQKLTELLGATATLRPLEPAENVEFYKRYRVSEEQFAADIAEVFAREEGEPMPDISKLPEVIIDHVSVPGTFFDNEELHLITSDSMAFMQDKNPQASWDVRRFRPNFYIETSNARVALTENDWVGHHLKIGETVLEISAPTVRCGMTVRPQADLPFDKSILRTVVKEGDQCLGVGAHCRQAGVIRAGDSVELID